MSHAVSILSRAQHELEDLPQDVYQRVAVALRTLVDDPRPPGCQKLSGRDAWRIRVGDYRVLYEIDDRARTVPVVHIGHRRDVYR
ncbi:MAG: type II toxin-antitoxin system RelE family toxin [Candidatus Binatia bacterium]